MAPETDKKAAEVKAWINGRSPYECEETRWNWIAKRWPDLTYGQRVEIYDKTRPA